MKNTACPPLLSTLSRVFALCASVALFAPSFVEAADAAPKKPAEKRVEPHRGHDHREDHDRERAERERHHHAQQHHHERIRHLMEASEHLKAAGLEEDARRAREHAERISMELEKNHSATVSAMRVHELERKVEQLRRELEAVRKRLNAPSPAPAPPAAAADKCPDCAKAKDGKCEK